MKDKNTEILPEKMMMDKKSDDSGVGFDGVEADFKMGRIPNSRIHEMLFINTENRTFFANNLNYKLSSLNDFKRHLGDRQFNHYMNTLMPLSDGSDKMVTIGDLYLKDYGVFNEAEKKSLSPKDEQKLKLLITADESHIKNLKRKRETSLEEMSIEELYDAIKNENVPLLHYSKDRGFESTLNYLSSFEGKENLSKELVNLALEDNRAESAVQKAMQYLSRSQISTEFLALEAHNIKGKSINLGDLAKLAQSELKDLYSINEVYLLGYSAVKESYGLLRLYVKNVGLNVEELHYSYGDKGNKLLHIAVKLNEIDLFNHLIALWADVDIVNKEMKTPLHLAAELGRVEILKLLIQEYIDINSRDRWGLTPLQCGISRGQTKTVELLISNGANVNIKECMGETPLHIAAEYGRAEIAELLIQENVDINARDDSGKTPIHLGVSSGHTKIIELLMRRGADINIASNNGTTLLHAAAIFGKTEIAKMLIQAKIDVNVKDKYGQTPLHLGISYSETAVVKLLIEEGADLSVADNEGETPLHVSARRYESTEIAELLIQKNVDINAKDSDGQTALHHGARIYNTEIVKLLIEKGADVSIADNEGETPLHVAACFGRIEIVKLLIQARADVNAKEEFGTTPLLKSVLYGKPETVELLIANGADANIANNRGETPLHWAAEFGKAEIAKLLIQAMADVNAKDKNGQTPLFLGVSKNKTEFVKLLIENGAKVSSDMLSLNQENKEMASLLKDSFEQQSKNASTVNQGMSHADRVLSERALNAQCDRQR